LAIVLGALGSKAAYVVHGADGLDELTTTGPNLISRLQDGKVESYEFDGQTLGLKKAGLDDLVGGTPEENAQITLDILSGKDQGPRRDIVLLNAAAALALSCDDLAAGMEEARESIDNGHALRTLKAWIEKTNSFGG
jgi:anthranilate phosphoribosyltransferase